jgi:hypothetical protein
MDIWIATDSVNQDGVLSAIREFAFPNAPDDLLHEPDAMIRMGVPPLRIEVLKSISGVDFEDCWPRRVSLQAEEIEVPLIFETQ